MNTGEALGERMVNTHSLHLNESAAWLIRDLNKLAKDLEQPIEIGKRIESTKWSQKITFTVSITIQLARKY